MLEDLAFATGPVAVLMNNAGIGGHKTTPWSEAENWDKLLDVNFKGVLRGQMAFLPRMIEANRPAVVINTGSKQAASRAAPAKARNRRGRRETRERGWDAAESRCCDMGSPPSDLPGCGDLFVDTPDPL